MSIDIDFTTIISDEDAAHFSAQEEALTALAPAALWVTAEDDARLERLLQAATDYTYPAGQAQAGIQLATTEVPRLLEEIGRLRAMVAHLPFPSSGY